MAVLGLGEAGHTLHLPALAGMDGVEVVAGCDSSSDMRERAAAAWKVPVFGDFDEVLALSPDVVIVATPPDSHLRFGLKVLNAGAHLICEKPFVTSLTEADTLMEAAREAGRRIGMNHEFKEMPILRALRDTVSSGSAGSLVFAQVWQLMDRPPGVETGWRGELVQRTLYEAGAHLVDFLMALFGECPVAVTASMSEGGVAPEGTDAVALVTLEFSGGRLATIMQSRLCKGPRQYFEVRADTTETSLRASFGGRARVTAGLFRSTRPHVRAEFGLSGMAWSETGTRRTFLARNPGNPIMLATRRVLTDTLAGFRDGGPVPTDALFARDGLRVIAASYHSARVGRRIELDSSEASSLATMAMGGRPS